MTSILTRTSFIYFLIASLVTHIAVVTILVFLKTDDATSEKIEISFLKAPEETPKQQKAFSGGGGKASAMNKRSLSLKDIGFGSSTARLLKNVGSEDPFGSQDPSDWRDSGSYASNTLNSFEGLSAAQAKYATTLWRKIDQAVESPSYLSEYNHTGKIHLRFEIDENGFLKEDKLRACGENNVLKVLAVKALRKAILDENKELQNLESNTQFFAQFSWADHQTCRALKGINKNHLSFCHYAENKRKEFTTSEKTGTYLKALTYGPGMFEEIEKYQREEKHRKNEFDPLAKLRTDPDWNLGC